MSAGNVSPNVSKYSADYRYAAKEDKGVDTDHVNSPEGEPSPAYLIDRVDSEAALLSQNNEDLAAFDLNSRLLVDSDDGQKQLTKTFSSSKQLHKLFRDGFILWIRTAVLLGFLAFTLWNNVKKAVMGVAEKMMFNTFMTALSIALGLNIATSLNAMGLNLRWWILSRKNRVLSEVDTILKSDISSLSSYLLSPRPWAVGIALSWLLINIVSQIGVAVIGLTYSMDISTEAALLVPNSDIMISNLTAYFPTESTSAPTLDAEQYTANFYGTMSLFAPPENISMAPQPYDTCGTLLGSVWCGDNYCLYTFTNWSPDLQTCVFSDRTVRVTSSCIAQSVIVPSGNGSYNYIELNQPTEQQMWVPSVGPAETTYFPGPTGCGPRCQQIMAFEPSLSSPWLYTCNNTVSEVSNTAFPGQILSDAMANMSASALYLGGSRNSNANHSATPYHRYPPQSLFGQSFNGSPDYMSSAVAQFTTGAIAIMDLYNPFILSTGMQPQPGYELYIPNKGYLYITFSLIGGLQLILVIITTFMANRVLVTDDSPLAIARLLRPIVDRLGPSGTILTGAEISKALKGKGDAEFIYTVTRYDLNEKKRYRLGLNGDRERAFPNGKYD